MTDAFTVGCEAEVVVQLLPGPGKQPTYCELAEVADHLVFKFSRLCSPEQTRLQSDVDDVATGEYGTHWNISDDVTIEAGQNQCIIFFPSQDQGPDAD